MSSMADKKPAKVKVWKVQNGRARAIWLNTAAADAALKNPDRFSKTKPKDDDPTGVDDTGEKP